MTTPEPTRTAQISFERFVESVRVFVGSVQRVGCVQIEARGSVATYFISVDQLRQIYDEARLALMKAGEPDPAGREVTDEA